MSQKAELAPRTAKGRPQVSRSRAERLLEALVTEAQAINADPLPWYDVTRLSVFGSYLSDKPVLGDLDIAVRTTPRWLPETGGFARAWQEFQASCPAPASIARSQLDRIHWPRIYVLKRLKGLGRGISVHAQEDLDACGFAHRVIFEKSESDVQFRK